MAMVVDVIVVLGLPLWLGVEELLRLRSEWSTAGGESKKDYGRRSATAMRTPGTARSATAAGGVTRATAR